MQMPPEPDAPLIHERNYDIRVFRLSGSKMQMRGVIHDQKPAGLYFRGDTEPLSVHHMVVDLILDFPSLTITDVSVVMNVTPHYECNSIEDTYQQLVGTSIARGFTRKVKDLFGRSLGCTHIGALLQAMAPVAVQSIWSMRAIDEETGTMVSMAPKKQDLTDEEALAQRKQGLAFNIDSCHIWDKDGEQVKTVMAGKPLDPPVWAVDRIKKLGIDKDSWLSI